MRDDGLGGAMGSPYIVLDGVGAKEAIWIAFTTLLNHRRIKPTSNNDVDQIFMAVTNRHQKRRLTCGPPRAAALGLEGGRPAPLAGGPSPLQAGFWNLLESDCVLFSSK